VSFSELENNTLNQAELKVPIISGYARKGGGLTGM
jgi:hypothetical protein